MFLFFYFRTALCVPTYHIYHNRHFLYGHKHVYYILGNDILYSICNENFIYLFNNLDVDCLTDVYILIAKYFHISYIQIFLPITKQL